MRYTDEQQAEAVAILQSEGYPNRKGALTKVSEQLGIPVRTLRRWAKGENRPPSDTLVRQKRASLKDLIEDELHAIMRQMPGQRKEADYRALATAFGILTDKHRLLSGDSTQNKDVTIRFSYPDDDE